MSFSALAATAVLAFGFQNCGPLPDPKTDEASLGSTEPTPTPGPTFRAERVAIDPAKITATGVYQTNVPANVYDENAATYWNSGGLPPATLTFTLNQAIRFCKITLTVVQSPSGVAAHEIWVGPTGGPMRKVADLTGDYASGLVLEATLDEQDVQVIEVRTTAEPSSWVAWGEINIFQKLQN
ncbi:MAG: hypothetical protein ABL958_04865 [Bdellovibrionia bacterium]